ARVERDLAENISHFTLSQWEMVTHLWDRGIRDFALLRNRIPTLFAAPPYDVVKQLTGVMASVQIPAGEETLALTDLFELNDIDPLKLVLDLSDPGLAIGALLRQFHALTAPASLPTVVTETEFAQSSEALAGAQALFDQGTTALGQSKIADARKHLNEAA